MIIFAGTNGYLDDLEAADCRRFERELYAFLESNYRPLLKKIVEKKALDDTLRGEISQALEAFSERFTAGAASAAAD